MEWQERGGSWYFGEKVAGIVRKSKMRVYRDGFQWGWSVGDPPNEPRGQCASFIEVVEAAEQQYWHGDKLYIVRFVCAPKYKGLDCWIQYSGGNPSFTNTKQLASKHPLAEAQMLVEKYKTAAGSQYIEVKLEEAK